MSEDAVHLPATPRVVQATSILRLITAASKRLFDLVASAVGMLLLSPLFLYLVVRIRRDSPGPIFYWGPRMGLNGRQFKIMKFRTMYETPQSYAGPRVTAQGDPRITPLGKWLRDTKMNELPQLWNVFKGEMSLVGPRPEDPEIAATWPEDARREVLSMRPGVTSPASVLYRDEESLLKSGELMATYLDEILPSKLRLDQLYVRHYSFWSDLDVLFWTVLVLLPKVRTYSPGEARLFVGPFNRLMQRYINWFILDTLITLLALVLAGLLWRTFEPLNVGLLPASILALGFAMLFSLANALLGVNRIAWSRAAATDALDLLPGAALATALALALNIFYPWQLIAFLSGGATPAWVSRPVLPPMLLLIAAALAFTGFMVARFRTRLVTGIATRWVNWRGPAASTRERVLIVGGGETGRFAAWMLNQGRYATSYHVVGFVDDDLYKQDSRIHGVHVVGQRAEIKNLVAEHDIGIIVFAIHNIAAQERKAVIDICHATQAQVLLFPDIPAALGDMRREPAQHDATESERTAYTPLNEKLPCQMCLTKVSPMKVDDWLAKLEMASEAGDLELVQTQIQELRDLLRSDVIAQVNANHPDKPISKIRGDA